MKKCEQKDKYTIYLYDQEKKITHLVRYLPTEHTHLFRKNPTSKSESL